MQHIDEQRLEIDLAYRFGYLMRFMGLSADDLVAIRDAAPALAPLVPTLVDAVYDKLIQFDATWRHFLPRQDGFEGALPESIQQLGMDHPQIQFRKQHLARYLTRLVSSNYDGKMIEYLDMVGKMHTEAAGSKEISVPLVQMNALMGFVSDALIATILAMPIETTQKERTLRAFNKLLWVQNDLIARHYASGEPPKRRPSRPLQEPAAIS